MRLYFGRIPENINVDLDLEFSLILKNHNYDFQDTVNYLVDHYLKNGLIYYSCNPLIFNYMEDAIINYLWIVDEDCNHIELSKDEHFKNKLNIMQIGEALCDDCRSYL